MTADLSALIARLEAAEVGSRELDSDVARLFGWHRVEPRFSRNKHGGWIAPEDFIGLYSDGSPKLDSLHGTPIHRDPPRLTQSLDAALALAERVLPEWLWEVTTVTTSVGKNRKPFAMVMHPDHPAGEEIMTWGSSATPTLALCIAILRAKQGEG